MESDSGCSKEVVESRPDRLVLVTRGVRSAVNIETYKQD
jgi:hypothetical protein